MGTCCSSQESAIATPYGSKSGEVVYQGTSKRNNGSGSGGASTTAPGGSSGNMDSGGFGAPHHIHSGHLASHHGHLPTSSSSYGQRAFVYPKMPALPKRTSMSDDDYTTQARKSEALSEARLEAFFDRYSERPSGSPNLMLSDGIVRFCADLGVDPEAFPILAFAWKCEAAQMCRFTREEFIAGCRRLSADDTRTLNARLPTVSRELSDSAGQFKEFYRWAYRFALDSEIGQRILSLDLAVQLWRLVFVPRPPLVLDDWLEFLMSSLSSVRGIPRDTWNMFLYFVDTVGTNFSAYCPDEAWPSLIDDFVEWKMQKDQESGRSTTGADCCDDVDTGGAPDSADCLIDDHCYYDVDSDRNFKSFAAGGDMRNRSQMDDGSGMRHAPLAMLAPVSSPYPLGDRTTNNSKLPATPVASLISGQSLPPLQQTPAFSYRPTVTLTPLSMHMDPASNKRAIAAPPGLTAVEGHHHLSNPMTFNSQSPVQQTFGTSAGNLTLEDME